MRVVVTGANGFIGRCLVQYLLREGVEVIAPRSDEWRLGQELPENCRKADVVIHLACAILSGKGDKKELANIDYDGTNLLIQQHRSLKKMGLRNRFIFVSSQSAQAHALNEYGKSKWAIESLFSEDGEIIVRPGLVYSPNSGSVYDMLSKLVKLPFLPAPRGLGSIQPIHVEELAHAFYRMGLVKAPLKVYSLGQERALTFSETVCSIAKSNKVSPPICVPFPKALIRYSGQVFDLVFRPSSSMLERIDGLLGLQPMRTHESLTNLDMSIADFGNK